jgi:hypothetical protein
VVYFKTVTQYLKKHLLNRGRHERLLFARYPGMLHDIMRLHIVFVMALPLQNHIIDKLFVKNKDLTPSSLPSSLLEFIELYNKNAKPFRWTYTGDPLTI